jgi:hypothetical protein
LREEHPLRMRIPVAAAAILLASYAAPALADRDPQSGAPLPPKKHKVANPITDHFYVRASFFGASVSSDVRADPTNAAPGTLGTQVNGESDLGLPSKLDAGRVEFMFRLRDRNKVRVDYFDADRSGNAVLANDVVFSNQTFLAGLPTQSSLDWKQFDITYTYSFIRNDHFELGTGLAIYFLQLDVQMTQPQPFGIAVHQEVSAASPLPALPLDATWCISSRWAATARIAYLRANLHEAEGWYSDSHADLQYRWNDHFALGAGYTSTRTSITSRSNSDPGRVDLSIRGPEAFIRLSY